MVAIRKCLRHTFTEEQYAKYLQSFWRMPSEWGVGEAPFLSRIWKTSGGRGAVGLLPLLGQTVGTKYCEKWRLSLEEAARLVNRDPKTVTCASNALRQLGLAESQVELWQGQWVTTWHCQTSLAAELGSTSYFYFPSRFVYGGNWADMSDAQRQVFLAIGSRAQTSWEHPSNDGFLRMSLDYESDLSDLNRCFEYQDDEPAMRYAQLSIMDLRRITSLSKGAVSNALESFRNLGVRSLLGIYRTRTGSHLFHIRDHAQPSRLGSGFECREREQPRIELSETGAAVSNAMARREVPDE